MGKTGKSSASTWKTRKSFIQQISFSFLHAPDMLPGIQEYILVTHSCLLFVTPWTVALQAPLSTGILQARVLEWVAMTSPMGSSQPRDQTQVCTEVFFTI